jgi:alpha-glucosidase
MNLNYSQQYSVHSQIFRLRFGVQETQQPRSWDVCLLRDACPSTFLWDGTALTHPTHGTLLKLVADPDCDLVQLSDLPELFARPGDQLPEGLARHRITMRIERDMESAYYGLGQRVHPLRRDPGTYSNWNVDPPTGHHRGMPSLYQSQPYFISTKPGKSVGYFLNSTWFSRFDLGDSKADEISISTLGGQIELYVMVGTTPSEVTQLLSELTGKPPLPPRWALGYHQSRWGYKGETEIFELVHQFRGRNIPLDVVHLDIDYMDQYRSFTFDSERFPAPAKLTAELKELGVRIVTIIDPGIRFDLQSDYPVARDGTREGHFLRNPDGSPFSSYCWPDAALFTDYCSPEARRWWGELTTILTSQGISGIWIDMNEPAVFSRPFSEGFSSQHPMPLALQHAEGAQHAEVHNLYGHLMAQATYEGLLQSLPEDSHERPWVLTRSAFIGTQRYAFAWMGDNSSWWEHLAVSLPQLISMGLSGQPFVGVDIGGFFGNTTAELLERWMELAVFYPFMRNHSAVGTLSQEPWRFGPETEDRIRQQIQLRYRLLPYIEELARQAHLTGEPLLRALFYEFPDDPDSYVYEDQALFGPWLMLAPITRPGHRQRMVYFPPGTWYDFWSDRHIVGPRTESWPAPLGQIPLFLRQGACLPMSEVRMHSSQPVYHPTWVVCPGPETTQGLWGDWSLTLSDQKVTLSHPRDCALIVRRPGSTQHLQMRSLEVCIQ